MHVSIAEKAAVVTRDEIKEIEKVQVVIKKI